MKRKILPLTMLIALAMTTLLAACGSNDVPANAIVDTPAPTISPTPTPESSSPEVDDKEDGIVSSGTLDEIPDANEDGNEKFSLGTYDTNGIRTVYTKLFNEGTKAEAWLQEHHFENPDYSYYITYFKNGDNANEMSFSFVAPVGIGDAYWLSGSEKTFQVSSDNRTLVMWHGGKLSTDSSMMKNTNIDTIMDWSTGDEVMSETYQVVEDTDVSYRVIFKEKIVIDDVPYIGYATFIDYYGDINECYQFEYFMTEDTYSEAEAFAVVNSIQYVNIDDLGIIVEE